jgi:hypothetical protein
MGLGVVFLNLEIPRRRRHLAAVSVRTVRLARPFKAMFILTRPLAD